MYSRLFNKALTLTRPVISSGTTGGMKVDYAGGTVVAANVPCSLQPVGGGVGRAYGKRTVNTTHVAYVAQDLGVRSRDRVTVDGVDYQVEEQADMAGRGRMWAIYLKHQA